MCLKSFDGNYLYYQVIYLKPGSNQLQQVILATNTVIPKIKSRFADIINAESTELHLVHFPPYLTTASEVSEELIKKVSQKLLEDTTAADHLESSLTPQEASIPQINIASSAISKFTSKESEQISDPKISIESKDEPKEKSISNSAGKNFFTYKKMILGGCSIVAAILLFYNSKHLPVNIADLIASLTFMKR